MRLAICNLCLLLGLGISVWLMNRFQLWMRSGPNLLRMYSPNNQTTSELSREWFNMNSLGTAAPHPKGCLQGSIRDVAEG